MYQMPSGDKIGRQNGGLPVSLPPEYAASKSLHHFSGAGDPSSLARVEQLEAEVQRLRAALAEKTVEAQNLQLELQSALQVVGKHQTSSQQPQQQNDTSETEAVEVGDTSANEEEEPRDTPTTAANSQD